MIRVFILGSRDTASDAQFDTSDAPSCTNLCLEKRSGKSPHLTTKAGWEEFVQSFVLVHVLVHVLENNPLQVDKCRQKALIPHIAFALKHTKEKFQQDTP